MRSRITSFIATLCTVAAVVLLATALPAAHASNGQKTQAVLDAASDVVTNPGVQVAASAVPYGAAILAGVGIVLNLFGFIFHSNQNNHVNKRVDNLHEIIGAGKTGNST